MNIYLYYLFLPKLLLPQVKLAYIVSLIFTTGSYIIMYSTGLVNAPYCSAAMGYLCQLQSGTTTAA